MDGQIVSWPQLVPPIELKHDLGKDHNIALGQLSSRFSHMLEQQPDRKPHCVRVHSSIEGLGIVGVCGTYTVHRSNLAHLFPSGLLSPSGIRLDKESTGLDALIRLVTSSCLENGYPPPEDISC